MDNWINSKGKNDDIVLSSRVRLARNIKGIPFPNKIGETEGRQVVEIIKNAFLKSKDENVSYNTINMWEIDELLGGTYIEKHLISEVLLENRDKSAFIVDSEDTVSIMINEEDHLRLQSISSGLNLKECYEVVNNIDNILEEELDFAYDERLGYLTSCPTNIGTGLRASVMIHLPMLTKLGSIEKLINMLSKMGMTIRGLFGEGSKGYGNLYQISNQVTLGPSESEIIDNLIVVVDKIIKEEKEARRGYLNNYRNEFEDKIMRSLGILKYCRILSTKEALELLSYLRMGVEMNIITGIERNLINKLTIESLPATIQSEFSSVLNENERNIKRAEIMRKILNNQV